MIVSNFKCKAYARQFIESPQSKPISAATKELIDKLLLEKVPLESISRVCGVSESWLQTYVNCKYEAAPRSGAKISIYFRTHKRAFPSPSEQTLGYRNIGK